MTETASLNAENNNYQFLGPKFIKGQKVRLKPESLINRDLLNLEQIYTVLEECVNLRADTGESNDIGPYNYQTIKLEGIDLPHFLSSDNFILVKQSA